MKKKFSISRSSLIAKTKAQNYFFITMNYHNATFSNLILKSYIKASPFSIFRPSSRINFFNSEFSRLHSHLFCIRSSSFFLQNSQISHFVSTPIYMDSEPFSSTAELLSTKTVGIEIRKSRTLDNVNFQSFIVTAITINAIDSENINLNVTRCSFKYSKVSTTIFIGNVEGSILSAYDKLNYLNINNTFSYQTSVILDNCDIPYSFYLFNASKATIEHFNSTDNYAIDPDSNLEYQAGIFWAEGTPLFLRYSYLNWNDHSMVSSQSTPKGLNYFSDTSQSKVLYVCLQRVTFITNFNSDENNPAIKIDSIYQTMIEKCGFIGFNSSTCIEANLITGQFFSMQYCCFENQDAALSINSTGAFLDIFSYTQKIECDLDPDYYFVQPNVTATLSRSERVSATVTVVLFIALFVIIFATLTILVFKDIGAGNHQVATKVIYAGAEEDREVSMSD